METNETYHQLVIKYPLIEVLERINFNEEYTLNDIFDTFPSLNAEIVLFIIAQNLFHHR
jgi:hypothetical protein